MKKIVAVLVILALVAGGVFLVKKKRGRIAQEKPPAALAVVVDARLLEMGAVALTQRTTADVLAVRESVVASRLSAYVTALPLFEGDSFKRGEVLARLDMVPSGGGAGGSLRADLAAAESSLTAEHERLARARELYKIQGVSLEQLQSAEASYAAARARRAAASENLANATIVAPFSGVVSQRLAQPGELATPGKPLLKIVDRSSGMRLVVGVPEDAAPTAMRVGDRSLPLRPWPEAGLQGLRRFEARSDGAFVPGSRVAVQLEMFRAGQAVFLPRACIFRDDAHAASVLRLTEDGKAEPRRIALAGQGEEGVASLDTGLGGLRVACASPDILTRLAAGVPFQVRGK